MSYDAERAALYEQYREAARKITLLSLRDVFIVPKWALPLAAPKEG